MDTVRENGGRQSFSLLYLKFICKRPFMSMGNKLTLDMCMDSCFDDIKIDFLIFLFAFTVPRRFELRVYQKPYKAFDLKTIKQVNDI